MSACQGCGTALTYRGYGRPPLYCPSCNREKLAARQRAYYEANREKLAARKRAYREANREKLAARERAYREANREKVAARKRAYYEERQLGLKTVTCTGCGERLARRTPDGLCGFCRQGIPA